MDDVFDRKIKICSISLAKYSHKKVRNMKKQEGVSMMKTHPPALLAKVWSEITL